MAYVRKGILDDLTDEELFRIVTKNLDELGIAYEQRPGGLGGGPFLDPSIFDAADRVETFTIRTSSSHDRSYCPKRPATYGSGLMLTDIWDGDHQVFWAA